jgi:hypothetical protein
MTSGARLEMVSWGFHVVPVGSRVFFLPPGCSFKLPGVLGVEVDDVCDDSGTGSVMKRLFLASKLSHVGVNVDGLACPLHQPMAHSCQVRG